MTDSIRVDGEHLPIGGDGFHDPCPSSSELTRDAHAGAAEHPRDAAIITRSPDFEQLEAIVNATLGELEKARVTKRQQTVLADAGYWHRNQTERLSSHLEDWISAASCTEKRQRSIEPVFRRIKHHRGSTRFRRRGRAAARSECA